MTAVRLPRLSRPGVFESIDPKRLFELLHPYADFFANRSVPIETPDSIDCQAVIREITKADRETPADLLDAICLIDELANTVAIELLLDRIPAHTLGIVPGGKHSAADIVTAAWLSNPEKLVQTHALSRIKRVRSYDYFQASQTTAPKFVTPAEETLQQLERDIDSWHVERFRAQGTRVEVFENADEVEFSIMHGSLFRRQRIVENGQFGFQSFWPVQSASAIYNREFGELRINAKTGKEKALYCRLLGKHMFGNENLFPTGIKYTLDPLREFEFDALAPGGIEGVSDVRMIELWLGDPDDRYGVISIFSKDVIELAPHRQRYFAGHSVSPEGGACEELVRSQMQNDPAGTIAAESRILDVRKKIDEAFVRRFKKPLFRPHDMVTGIAARTHRFAASNVEELYDLAKDLRRIFIESIDDDFLKSLTPSCSDDLGSIKRLCKLLDDAGQVGRSVTAALAGVHELRQASAHLPRKSVDEAFSLVGVALDAPSIISAMNMIESVVNSIDSIANGLETSP